MKAIKHSKQRDSIKTCLMGRRDHPTADAVYMSIREEFPNISLGTVYRNLNLLVELGEIQKLTCGNGPDRFDADTSPHYHFVCRECGHVYDMDIQEMDELNAAVQSHAPGHIDSHSILFFGQCQSCMDMENPKKDQKTIDKTA